MMRGQIAEGVPVKQRFVRQFGKDVGLAEMGGRTYSQLSIRLKRPITAHAAVREGIKWCQESSRGVVGKAVKAA